MLRAGHGLILITLALLTFGVIMVNSAGLTVGAERALTLESLLLGKHTVLAVLAVAALLIASIIPIDEITRLRGHQSPIPYIIALSILLLVAVRIPGIGREVNGAWRWIHFGPVNFQPSELAKWGMVIVLGWFGAKHAHRIGRFFTGLLPALALLGIVCALIATEDLGTAVLIFLVGIAMLLAAGARFWQVALLLPLGALGAAAAVIQSPYRLERLRAFLDPYQDPRGIGYHMIQSMAAVAHGGLPGRGLGNGIHKFGYLPEDTNDFLFAIICEELGIVGAAVVIMLYAMFTVCALSILRRATQPLHRLIAFGVLLTVGLQALINLMVVTGLGPTKGIALPMLSAGGTGWVLTAFSVGLLVSIDRQLSREADRLDEPTRSRPPTCNCPRQQLDGHSSQLVSPAANSQGRTGPERQAAHRSRIDIYSSHPHTPAGRAR